MSDSHYLSDDSTSTGAGQRSLSGDELLPPVEPPSARFIVQLFVVPAVIVLLIVVVWLMVSWLVHRTRPKDLVEGLKGSGVARWQRASELADILRNKRYADLKLDANAASSLAATLKREIDVAGAGGEMKNEDVMLRFFLCRALGEFEVPEGTDALILAAQTNREAAEQWVRRGAIQAIAVRAYNMRQRQDTPELDASELETTLIRLADDPDPVIRSETAYALGRIGSAACVERLETMIDDPHADTRYNAAVALAHWGNAKGVEVLAEMLEPVSLPSVTEVPEAQTQVNKRATIIHNAVEAAIKLQADKPNTDMSPVVKALQAIVNADERTLATAMISRGAVSDAKRGLDALQKH